MLDLNIVAQTTAKVTAELVASTQPRSIEDALMAYDKAFVHVLNSIKYAANDTDNAKKSKGGRSVPILSQDEIQMRINQKLVQPLQAGTAVTTNTLQSF